MLAATGDDPLKPDETRFVCHGCIGDKLLAEQVARKGTQSVCSYCQLSKAALTLADLSNRIHQVLEEFFEPIPIQYEDDVVPPEDNLTQQWRDYLEDTETVIGRIANLKRCIASDVRDNLFNKVASAVNIEEGEENPYSHRMLYLERETDSTDFRLAWREFREEIHSRARFFGASTEGRLDEIFANLTSLTTFWGDTAIREIKPGGKDSSFWRARTVYSDSELEETLKSPSQELGPPPSNKARAGRMNAEGIPVFYGALEDETCVSEIRAPVGSLVVLAKFDLLKPILIVDLDALSEVYSEISYFHPHYIEERSRERFLRDLVKEIGRPVMPHEEAHEYLATQIVSEYLANRVRPQLHGMLFRSSQTGGSGRNVVLFSGACGVEVYKPPSATGLRVTVPRQPRIPPPWTEPNKDLIIQTEPPGTVVEAEWRPGDSGTGDLRDLPDGSTTTLMLDITSMKALTISGVKYEAEAHPIKRVNYVSGSVSFGPMSSRAILSVRTTE